MTMYRISALLLLLLLAPTFAAGSENQHIPRLGDHVFVPNMALIEPFINTHIQTTVSLGNTKNALTPVIDLTDEENILGFVEADIVVAAIGFKYQHKVKDWLAAGLSLDVTGRVGTSTPSLVSEGLTGAIGYQVGWLIRAYSSEKFLLSCSANIGTSNATFINLIPWVDGILAGQNVSLVQARQSVSGTGGAHAAWALSRRFGLLGSLNFSYGEPFDSQSGNSWVHNGRLALSYDMAYELAVPLGLALTGGHYENQQSAVAENGVWFWSARIALQSKNDFSIGLDIQNSYVTGTETLRDYKLSQVSIDMRYFY
jgi:hypothetical protein